MTVIVVDANSQPPQPVKAARVSLTHLINAQLIVDAQSPTNPRGEAQLLLSQSAAKNGDLRIVISGVSNLVIYQPADGQLSGLKSPIKVILLPTGSLALLGPAQIQAYLHRLLLEVNSLQKQVNTLKAGTAQGQSQQQYLTAAMAEFAQTMGFSHDQVDMQVAIWAQNIKLQAARATTADQRGLADFALKDYAAAARDFNEAGDATQEKMNADEAAAAAYKKAQQNAVDATRDDLRKLIDQRQSAAGADQLSLKYHDATQVLESAAAAADAEYKKHPDDKGFHELWLQAVWSAAAAQWLEGEVAPADQSLSLLAQSAGDYASLAREYAALGDHENAAAAQLGLGNALDDEAERTSGDKSVALLDQALQAYQNALQVFTKANLPQDWAATQVGLGYVLMDEGERAGGENAAALLDQAVQAYRSALEVYTRADLPQDWALTQNSLGIALMKEEERANGDKAAALLDQAVQAFRSALEVRSRADLPEDWAQTQNNLGNALLEGGERAGGEKSVTLFDQAVQAFRSALEVRTKADLPQKWAMTQNNLGNALLEEGERAGGDKGAALLDQAVRAYRSALEVDTRADLPQDWAGTQNNLGIALLEEGERTGGDKGAGLFDEAVQAYRSALEVRTKTDLPQDWAKTQVGLGDALRNEGERAGREKAAALLDRAAQAYRSALEVYTKADFPRYWALTMRGLAATHRDLGDTASADAELKAANEVDPQ